MHCVLGMHCVQNAVRMTSLGLEDFLLLPVQHVRHLVASIEHLLACPISDVDADHVTALRHIGTGIFMYSSTNKKLTFCVNCKLSVASIYRNITRMRVIAASPSAQVRRTQFRALTVDV